MNLVFTIWWPNDTLTDDEERASGIQHETKAHSRSSSFGRVS